ncbi:MAG: FkbM family methyltransferase [Planctomycetota bacterium]
MSVPLRKVIRACLRPAARQARRWLDSPPPPKPPTTFQWQTLKAGPAAGIQLKLPSPSVLSDRIVNGQFEALESQLVTKLIGNGDQCIDIGGHYGHFTMLMSSLASEGHVHTFEPVPAHAQRLSEAVSRSKRGNVTIHEMAVAETEGEMRLRFADQAGDDSMAYLTEYGGVDVAVAREQYKSFVDTIVSTKTLDRIGEEVSEFGKVTFIKMDAEGAEAAIIRGGLRFLEQCRPRILMEIHGVQEALCCADRLWPLGYQAILLSTTKTTHPILWTAVQDDTAIEVVAEVLGQRPIVLTGNTVDR